MIEPKVPTAQPSNGFFGAKVTANARYLPMSGCATSQGDGTYLMSAVRSGVYRVQVFDRQGKFLFKWGSYGTKEGQFGGNTTPKSRVGGPQFVAVAR